MKRMNVRRISVILLTYVAAAFLVACQRETTQETVLTPTTATATAPTATVPAATSTVAGPPVDARSTNVNTVVALDTKKFVEKSLLGSAGPDGTVPLQKDSFKRTEPVTLTMWLTQSPAGLQASAIWYDENDKIVSEERREMKGAKLANFTWSAKKPKPGLYRVVGYWGGNIAAEHVFKITK